MHVYIHVHLNSRNKIQLILDNDTWLLNYIQYCFLFELLFIWSSYSSAEAQLLQNIFVKLPLRSTPPPHVWAGGAIDPTGAAYKLGGAQCGECPSQTGKTMIRTTCSPGWLVIEGSLWPFRHTDTHSLLSLSYIHPGFLQRFVLFGKRPRSSWTGPFAEMAWKWTSTYCWEGIASWDL